VYVWGAIDTQLVEPSAVEEKATDVIIPEIQAMFPGVETQLGGDIQEQQEQVTEQIMFFISALLVVYLLLAIPLKSYLQPFIVISVIPFSLTGAIWGHLFMGMDLSSMSTFGLVAAAGVVINDSLVMTHYINGVRAKGVAIKRAVIDAGCARFRAITLTSITTFAGVAPIMFEKSMQALLVVPMAVALGFSVLFATVITLILVPCLYVIFDDMKGLFRKLFGRRREMIVPSVTLET
jgi:multidrug efflux pump subunit AcrB